MEAAQLSVFSLAVTSTGFLSHCTATGTATGIKPARPRLLGTTLEPLTVLLHAQSDAALQSTVLAAISVQLVDGAFSRASTRVHQVLSDTALEEALTALTADGAVVTS